MQISSASGWDEKSGRPEVGKPSEHDSKGWDASSPLYEGVEQTLGGERVETCAPRRIKDCVSRVQAEPGSAAEVVPVHGRILENWNDNVNIIVGCSRSIHDIVESDWVL